LGLSVTNFSVQEVGSSAVAILPASYAGIFAHLGVLPVPSRFRGNGGNHCIWAVAERIKFTDFLVFSLIIVGIMYPITGHWVWGAVG